MPFQAMQRMAFLFCKKILKNFKKIVDKLKNNDIIIVTIIIIEVEVIIWQQQLSTADSEMQL